ncbi:TspO/MBR family protein [Rhodoligotrophos defluvii]|uniref:TspO/MBR family protein n=1 Tax=Rhodoligotrophos defluvii TaxID=2561934 RepID=UPI0010C9A0DE|nr:TspO/MBR family protein [Rhodoligotrophos defluvii]
MTEAAGPENQPTPPNQSAATRSHAQPAGQDSYTALIVAFVLCFAVAAIGSAFIISNLSPWYAGLVKPAFALPSWLIWPIQIMLYSLMAVSLWLVWKAPAARSLKFPALFIFGVQLVLNIAWPALFFGAQSPVLGLLVLIFLLAAVLATVFSFYRINRWASLLLWPHLVWITYDLLLNIAIWWLN